VQLQAGRHGGGPHGAADTYREDTCTLIVFPQGAVLRSSTNLATGQHLLLKNQKTNQEVPCRVVNLRSYSTGYVEIEFVRPAPGFWGIIFPSEASKPPAARVAPTAAPPKPLATPLPAPAGTPISKAHTLLPRPALSKNIGARSFPTKVSKPASLPGSSATPAPASPKLKEQPVAPPAAAPAAHHFVNEQPGMSSSTTSVTPHPAPDRSFLAAPSHEPEALPIADLVAIKPSVEKAAARSDRTAGTAVLPSCVGSLEEKEHWATLSHGRFSSFQVFGAEEETRDDFSLDAPSPVREREPSGKLVLIAASTAALVLAVGLGSFFLQRHSQKTAVVAASSSPAATPALEQPNPVPQPQPVTSPSTEALQTPLPPPPSVNPVGPPSTQTPPATTEPVISQPISKAPAPAKPAPRPSFKLAPNTAAPARAPVSRETPQPPAPGDEVAASPAGPAGISNGIMPDALRSDAEVPPPPAKTPERTGGEVKLPKLLHMVPPSYPLAAKQINLQGEVTVQASVDTKGKVIDAKVVSGPVLLQQAAMDAVRNWKYEPATLDGKPVPMQVIVKVKFRLN